jgi:hypothetical protein
MQKGFKNFSAFREVLSRQLLGVLYVFNAQGAAHSICQECLAVIVKCNHHKNKQPRSSGRHKHKIYMNDFYRLVTGE